MNEWGSALSDLLSGAGLVQTGSTIQWTGVSNTYLVDDMMNRLREPKDHAFNISDHPDVLGNFWCVDCYPMSHFRYDAGKHLYRIFELSLGEV